MNKITDALEDLKVLLMEGTAWETAVKEIAEEYSIPELTLTNRAKLAFGDLDQFAAKKTAEKELLAGQTAEAQRKLALAKVRDRIEAHNAVRHLPNHANFLPEDKLIEMIELANSMGARYVLTTHRRRAPRDPGKDIDRAISQLSKLLNIDLRKL